MNARMGANARSSYCYFDVTSFGLNHVDALGQSHAASFSQCGYHLPGRIEDGARVVASADADSAVLHVYLLLRNGWSGYGRSISVFCHSDGAGIVDDIVERVVSTVGHEGYDVHVGRNGWPEDLVRIRAECRGDAFGYGVVEGLYPVFACFQCDGVAPFLTVECAAECV